LACPPCTKTTHVELFVPPPRFKRRNVGQNVAEAASVTASKQPSFHGLSVAGQDLNLRPPGYAPDFAEGQKIASVDALLPHVPRHRLAEQWLDRVRLALVQRHSLCLAAGAEPRGA
jgi:hypothetical protein